MGCHGVDEWGQTIWTPLRKFLGRAIARSFRPGVKLLELCNRYASDPVLRKAVVHEGPRFLGTLNAGVDVLRVRLAQYASR